MKTIYSCFCLLILSIILSYCLGCFYNYFYPMKYKNEIVNYSSMYNLDSALIASVINVESGYNENSISSKGAIGLMQLMPKTAEWIANKNQIIYDKDKLIDSSYNLNLGCLYLKYLIELFNNEKNAICAYNAGLGNVTNWLKNKEYSDDGFVLKTIPFKETNDYLNRVYKNYHYYKNRYK